MKKNSGPSIVTALVVAGVAILVGIFSFLKFIPDHVLIQLGIDWKEVGNQLEETQKTVLLFRSKFFFGPARLFLRSFSKL